MKVDAISKTISSKGKISCYDCGKEFTNVEKAEKHMPETNCKPNKCNKCEKVFSQRSNCQATGTGTWDLGPGTWDLGIE